MKKKRVSFLEYKNYGTRPWVILGHDRWSSLKVGCLFYFFAVRLGLIEIFQTTDNDGLHEVIWTPKIKVWKVITLGLGALMEIIFLYFFYILQTIITRSVSNVRFDVRANYGAKYETVPLRPIERSFSILDDFKNSAYKLSCPGIQFAGIKFAGKIHI